MSEPKRGWPLLHSELPSAALKELSKSVYGVSGLTDVNEGYLILRLFASDLPWDWRIVKQEYLGFEDRKKRDADYTNRYYLAAVHGVLTIDGKEFHGSGAHDNLKLDAAFKGAATVAFKNATKWAGMWNQLLMSGRAIDFIYADRDGNPVPEQAAEIIARGTAAISDPEVAPGPPASAQAASSTPPAGGSESPAPRATAVKLELGENQIKALRYMVKDLPEDLKAKERAWAKMEAIAVRDPGSAFVLGIEELVELHTIACGPDCEHVKTVRGSKAYREALQAKEAA